MNKLKGFALIEMLVIIAILGILSLIAYPRFTFVQENSKIKADKLTSAEIIHAARVWETQNAIPAGNVELDDIESIMKIPSNSQSGTKGAFVLDVSDPNNYVVTWATGGSWTESGVLTDPTD